MTEKERVAFLERKLDKYDVAMNPNQIAEALGVTRRHVDRMFDKTDEVLARGGDPVAEGCLVYFVLDPEKQRKEKRVHQAALVSYMLKNENLGGNKACNNTPTL